MSSALTQRNSHQAQQDEALSKIDEDAAALHRALSELIRVYQFRDRDRICCYNVSVTQCHALKALVLKGPLGLNGLATELYLDKSTTSRVVDALERKGYVERSEDPGDGRALLLLATVPGQRLHSRIEADILAQEKQVLAMFAPDVRRPMIRLIAELAEAASRNVGGSGADCEARFAQD